MVAPGHHRARPSFVAPSVAGTALPIPLQETDR